LQIDVLIEAAREDGSSDEDITSALRPDRAGVTDEAALCLAGGHCERKPSARRDHDRCFLHVIYANLNVDLASGKIVFFPSRIVDDSTEVVRFADHSEGIPRRNTDPEQVVTRARLCHLF
jgi:hypothetical protein